MTPKFLTAVLALTASLSVQALVPGVTPALVIASGEKNGTYHSIIDEASKMCSSSVAIRNVVAPEGSIESLSWLVTNRVNAAIVHADQLIRLAQGDARLHEVYTLYALHDEALHFVTLPGAHHPAIDLWHQDGDDEATEGHGHATPEQPYEYLTDLRHASIVASRDASITAQAIKEFANLDVVVTRLTSRREVMKQVLSGEADVGLFVGGVPVAILNNPELQLNFLKVRPDTIELLKGHYTSTTLNYHRLGISALPALSTRALLLTRDYHRPGMQAALRSFRQCITDNIHDLREGLSNNPAWQSVDPKQRGPWPWLDLTDHTSHD